MLTWELICIGIDSMNSNYRDYVRHLTKQMKLFGFQTGASRTIGRNFELFQQSFSEAICRSDAVIVIGTLKTYGVDGVKDSVAEALRIPLELDEGVRKRIFASLSPRAIQETGETIPLFPRRSEVFLSEDGINSGCALAVDQQCVIMLPADPQHFYSMTGRELCGFLGRFTRTGWAVKTIRTFGKSRAELVQRAAELMTEDNPAVTAFAQGTDVVFQISAHGSNGQEALALCEPVLRSLSNRLGDAAYAIDAKDMRQPVFMRMAQKNLNFALAESGTEEALFQLCSEPAGERLVAASHCRTATELEQDMEIPARFLKKYGAASPKTAAFMAAVIRQKSEAALGLALELCPPSAEGQSFFACIALADEQGVQIQTILLPAELDYPDLCQRAALESLNQLRLYLNAATPANLIPTKAVFSGKYNLETEGDPSAPKQNAKRSSGWIARRIVLAVCALVLAGSGSYIGMHFYQSYHNEQQSLALEEIYNGESQSSSAIPENYPDGYQSRFAPLYALNHDIKGWIEIPNTPISYPVMQSTQDSETEQYYLRRDFYRKKNEHGVPFLDYRVDLQKPSDNLVIYGHNTKDGQMFQELLKYADLSFYQEHPLIRFDTVYGEATYKIIGMFITNTRPEHGEIFDYHNFIDAENSEQFLDYLYGVKIRSILETGIDAEPGDQLLTLSTCSYEFQDGRFVVVARKLREGESEDANPAAAAKNPAPLYPDIWYELYQGNRPDVPLTRPVEESTAPPEETQPPASEESSQTTESETSLPPETTETTAPPETTETTTETTETTAPPETTESSETTEPETEETTETEDTQESQETPGESEESGESSESSETQPPASSDETTDTRETKETARPSTRPPETEEEDESDVVVVRPPDESDESSNSPIVIIPNDREDEDEDEDQDDATTYSSRAAVSTLSVRHNGSTITADPATILSKVVAAEMGSANAEALKAQAVASYSYILYENEHGRVPSVAMRDPSSQVESAVSQVLGQAVYYGGDVAYTCYHATSGGNTNSSADVWGGSYPYLISVDSSIDQLASKYQQTTRISASQVAANVEKQLGISLSGDPSQWFEVLSTTSGGYNGLMSVGGQTQYYYDSTGKYHDITGRVMREAVLGLRSAKFDIAYDSSSGDFLFTTYGYGHGVGMSQTGAMLMAEDGANYVDILEHYYEGTTVY